MINPIQVAKDEWMRTYDNLRAILNERDAVVEALKEAEKKLARVKGDTHKAQEFTVLGLRKAIERYDDLLNGANTELKRANQVYETLIKAQ